MSALPGGAERSLGLVETQRVALWDERDPLVLESGERLDFVEVAYETYGELDAERSNCVYVCHALTGDAHAAGHHGDPARRGWWDNLIGPGKPLDTDQLYVVCANLLGGCQGTTGPSSIEPATGKPYGLRFPLCTVRDLVTVHRRRTFRPEASQRLGHRANRARVRDADDLALRARRIREWTH